MDHTKEPIPLFNLERIDDDVEAFKKLILDVSPRAQLDIEDLPKGTVIYDYYKLDLVDKRATWMGYSLDAGPLTEGANLSKRGRSDLVPPSGKVSYYDFMMFSPESEYLV